MSSFTTQEKIGQLFFIGIPGPELDDTTVGLLDRIQPGGICLFARNIRERRQTRNLLDALRSKLDDPLLSIDQEGGLVDRLRRLMTPVPAASKLRSVDDAAELGRIIAAALSLLGFNMDFAPVVDVVDERRRSFSNGLTSRAFGSSREDVAAYASAFLRELGGRGIAGCLKHFPGLGASEVDSHRELPTVSIDENEFFGTDLYPYRELLASELVDGVMVAHAAFQNVGLQEVDQNGKLLPSSLSPAVISNLLRVELGYDGLVLTDDLEMGAIVENYGIGEACVMAVEAGADMLAICASIAAIDEGHAAIREAYDSGRISVDRIDESVARISSLKAALGPPPEFDDDQLESLSNAVAELNKRLE
ncbi:MAG TPA: glycoside hydrolase family 3 N-terminal domain-containing protein [Pyrinomonadaceae bacterium]|nr:glycoside hydrolase family 3 N-terminal domain-containing protein [Pyrinomonadaceae bacterium]